MDSGKETVSLLFILFVVPITSLRIVYFAQEGKKVLAERRERSVCIWPNQAVEIIYNG